MQSRDLKIIEEDDPTPWNRGNSFKPVIQTAGLPESIEIVIGNEIYIPKKGLPPALKNRLVRLAAFPNPEFYKAQAMRLPTHDKPRLIACCSDHADHVAIPRGCLEDLCQLFSDLKIKLSLREELQKGIALKTKFLGKLRDSQEAAATALLKTDMGVLSTTTAFGKTVIGAWLIAKRKVNTLVLVHRKQLQEQWIERLTSFLELPKGSIGRIGGGKRKPTGLIDIAVIQSLVRKGIVDEIVTQYGHIIVDECHHLPVDPAWKADYASSVKRLVRDGIDLPLAHLFVQVATILPHEAEGIDRARSASERFLFQRLETLPQTKGLFRLNVELDIPFDGWGRMEVDLVCSTLKLAIEIDGSQHLSSVEAYRRDRRKDTLLQENGYKVLRFLAEDVGKCLDDVLDTILRVLSSHQQHIAKPGLHLQ